jgi:dipeptidase E
MTIIAMGGGGFSMEATPLLDDYVFAAARRSRPRVLFVPTASGDSADYIARFYRAMAPRCDARHLELFRRDRADLAAFTLEHDVIYVGGGNTANMLSVWRMQGFDRVLRDALAAGVVLAGVSAGAVCWFEGTVTDSFGPLAPLRDGVGLLPGALVPHYDGEAERRPTLHRLISDGTFDAAWAADDGAAFVFRDRALVEIVSSRPDASGYRVERGPSGVIETRLATRYLGR